MQRDYPPEVQAVNERARAAMKRGLALLEENLPANLLEAGRCFDAAIALRKSLPLAQYCWIRYGLIAGWMNRGDALTRIGGAENLAEALRSYDEALWQLRELPMNESPLFKKRLAITWLNRGVTLQKIGSPDALTKALQAFDEAIAAAQNLLAANFPEITETLACAWMNRGNVLLHLDLPDAAPARAAVNKSLVLLHKDEKENVRFAELALQSRHILCQALAALLETTSDANLLMEASDAVDEGLALARHWEARGEKQFSALAGDLFRFGGRIYQIHQPHFLTEFLLENLDPAKSPGAFTDNHDMHLSAMTALWQNLQELQRVGFTRINTPRFKEMLETLRELRITEERLTALRRHVMRK